MIVGLGIDLVELDRIRASLERFGERFIKRICTDLEIGQLPARDPAPRLATLFAAKEAGVKALGTGFTGGIAPRCVEVEHLPSGKPVIRFLGPGLERARDLGVQGSHVSLTHGRDSAAAVVVLEA